MKVSRGLVVAVFTVACATSSAAHPRQAPPAARTGTVNADAAALTEFKSRVDQFVAVKKQAQKGAPKLEETEHPAEITAAQDALAARIRTLRANAKAGDVFAPNVRTSFRRLLAPELKGADAKDTKAVLKEDAPATGAVPLTVNAKYPEGLPIPSTPANVLRSLPILPNGLEYRFIGKDLVLLDVDANIIVDYIRNALP